MTRCAAVLVLTISFSSNAIASECPATIPQLVANRAPNPVVREIKRELVPMTLREIAGSAAVVVRGTVRPIKTYLTSDQCDLLTDYAVIPEAIIVGSIPASSSPGPQRLLVTQLGGAPQSVASA